MKKIIKIVVYLSGGFAVFNLIVIFPAFMSGAPADWIGARIACALTFGGLSYVLEKWVVSKKEVKSKKPIMVVYGNKRKESNQDEKNDVILSNNDSKTSFSIEEKDIRLELEIRKKTRMGFDGVVADSLSEGNSNPLIDGLKVKAAIANFYQSMKQEKTMESMLKARGIDYQKILEEECLKAMEKYLKGDLYKL